MAKYEYLTVTIGGGAIARSKALNKLAPEGWELVCVDDGRAYFKRSVLSPPFDFIDQDGFRVDTE